MLRLSNNHPLDWADKTMSMLRADQLEACEKDLAGLPDFCLFDSEATDADAETFFNLSFYSSEPHDQVLHTIEDLRVQVLSVFAAETALLSPDEHDLLVRLVLFGGKYVLQDWNEVDPACSLVRRLWCRVDRVEGRMRLLMPRQLCTAALLLISGGEHHDIREAVDQVFDSIDNTLYLLGIMQAAAPASHLEELVKGTCAEGHPELIGRMLRAGNDYVFGRDGQMLLIHPGLAEPDRAALHLWHSSRLVEMSEEALSAALDSLDGIETPLFDHMLAQIQGFVRPELSQEDAVEDLMILAKQGVSFPDLREVLASQLTCVPTPEMLRLLREISAQVPRWVCLNASQVQ